MKDAQQRIEAGYNLAWDFISKNKHYIIGAQTGHDSLEAQIVSSKNMEIMLRHSRESIQNMIKVANGLEIIPENDKKSLLEDLLQLICGYKEISYQLSAIREARMMLKAKEEEPLNKKEDFYKENLRVWIENTKKYLDKETELILENITTDQIYLRWQTTNVMRELTQ